ARRWSGLDPNAAALLRVRPDMRGRLSRSAEYRRSSTVSGPDVRESAPGASRMREAVGVPAWRRLIFGPERAMTGDSHGDPAQDRTRERLELIRTRSEKSTSWRSMTHYLARLVN